MRKIKYAVDLSFIIVAMIVAFATANVSAQVYPSGMVSYWTFDETSGTTAYDVFGGNNGQLANGPVWTTGKVDGALSFDGVNDYVSVPHTSSISLKQLSVEFWAKPSAPPSGSSWVAQMFMVKGLDNDENYELGYYLGFILFKFTPGTELVSGGSAGGTRYLTVPVYRTFEPGKWYHIVGTFDGIEGRYYVNGAEFGYLKISGGEIVENDQPLIIGSEVGMDGMMPRYFPGIIDEVAIYNRALSAEEILQHYQDGLQGLGYEIPVFIDIKPGSFPNSINLMSKGNVPVAILSSPTFDATTIDRNTVIFAGVSPLPIGQTSQDVNGDGLMDIVLHFNTRDLNLQLGDTEACLTGKALSGQEFESCDSVRIVK